MSEWQPIETAPLDGTFVLVWAPDQKDKIPFLAQYLPRFPGDVDGSWYGWGENMSLDVGLTHWMPLPAAPRVLPPLVQYKRLR